MAETAEEDFFIFQNPQNLKDGLHEILLAPAIGPSNSRIGSEEDIPNEEQRSYSNADAVRAVPWCVVNLQVVSFSQGYNLAIKHYVLCDPPRLCDVIETPSIHIKSIPT